MINSQKYPNLKDFKNTSEIERGKRGVSQELKMCPDL